MTTPKIAVRLLVAGGDLDVVAITATMGIQPSQIWRTGEVIAGTVKPRRSDGWELWIDFEPGYILEEKIKVLQKLIGQNVSGVGAFCADRGYQIGISCVVEMDDETAGLVLSKELIKWLYELGATFEVDTYRTALRDGSKSDDGME